MSEPAEREDAAEWFEDAARAVRKGNDQAAVECVDHARLALREARMREREPQDVVRWERGP